MLRDRSPNLTMLSWSIIALFDKLAEGLPHASFAVKGSGEDPRDI